MARRTRRVKSSVAGTPEGTDGVIGWREWVALPELRIDAIKVKVDTGARSSALHAFDLRTFRRNGVRMVRFEVHPIQNDDETRVTAEAELADRRLVRTSAGHESVRPVIITRVELSGTSWPIELTLMNRDAMGFRMLLGREAIRNRFLVDPGRSYLAGDGSRARPEVALEPQVSPNAGAARRVEPPGDGGGEEE